MSKLHDVTPLAVRSYGRPPEPTVKNPFAQVNWIFRKRGDRTPTESASENYSAALTMYKDHLIQVRGSGPYRLRDEWDQFALLRLKEELLDRIDAEELMLSSYSLVGYFSAIRQTMTEAAAYGLLTCKAVQDVAFGQGQAETDAHTSYSERELSQIRDAVAAEMLHTANVLNSYKRQPSGVGRDPRITPNKGTFNGYGFGVEANARWYFENVMDAKAIVADVDGLANHNRFFSTASNIHGGLHQMYRRWGTTTHVDNDVLMPLAVSLLQLTGLNPSSMLGLKTDCLKDEHPLTGMPYLLFDKARSGGEQELHLPLLDAREERGLKRKQSLQVHRVIEKVLTLTSALRDGLPADSPLNNLLFIFESSAPNSVGRVIALQPRQTSQWCQKMVDKFDLRADDGSPLQFNLVRFRSTKLTEMALEGRDFFEIQQVARHKSIRQTVHYLAMNQLDAPGRKAVAFALKQIQSNSNEITAQMNPAAQVERPIHLYRGLIADCKNVFDPPDRIKRTVDYVDGQACTRFNMCLFCRNVVVMREHLPSLAAYRAQIRAAQANNVQNLPHSSFYDQSLSVIENLLDPETSQFTAEDIEWALEAALMIDEIVDPLLYRGACT